MTLDTFGYLTRASFHKLMKAHTATIQSEINALIGTSHDLAYYAQMQAETFPSIRGWVYLRDDPDSRLSKLCDMVQLDLFIQSASPTQPDTRLLELMEAGVRGCLDIRTARDGFYAYFDVKNWLQSSVSPPTIGRCRLELQRPGFVERPDEPGITRWQADFKLIHL